MERLTQKVWQGSQDWQYEALWMVLDGNRQKHQLLIAIKRDSYDFQSYLRCQRWDGTVWQPVCSTPFALADESIRDLSYVDKGVTAKVFEKAEKVLLDEALMVIGIR